MGSSVFHPESSRVARMASGGRPGLAQSLFQVGGNVGSALGPIAAAIVVLRWGRRGMGAFSLVALDLDRHPRRRRALVPASRSRASGEQPRRSGRLGACLGPHGAARARLDRGPHGARLLEVRLPRGPHELLHVLSHASIRRLPRVRADASLRVPRRGGRRNARWRPARRPLRSQAGRSGSRS